MLAFEEVWRVFSNTYRHIYNLQWILYCTLDFKKETFYLYVLSTLYCEGRQLEQPSEAAMLWSEQSQLRLLVRMAAHIHNTQATPYLCSV